MRAIKKLWKNAYARAFDLNDERDAEYLACVSDLLQTPEVRSLANHVQHFDVNRLEHVMSVSYLSYEYCRRKGLDYAAAARAGILHDLYYYDWHDGDWHHRPHGIRHPGFAVKNARRLCGGLDKKIENIIRSHMWPLTPVLPLSREAIAVMMADKFSVMQEKKQKQ